MPPNSMQPARNGLWQQIGVIDRLPVPWRTPLMGLAGVVAALFALTWREWGEMIHQWWNIDTYNHILLVPLIVIWLIWLKFEELAKAAPQAWGWGLVLIAAGLAMWITGRLSGLNLIAHAGAVGALQGALVAVLGVRVALLLALPIAFLAFLVPFGDEIIPPLQAITAKMAIALTQFSGIPAVIDGIYIDTPVGLFIVAEECSGVKFLIAMVTLAVLVAFTRFATWHRRAAFVAAAIIVPILANGVRAWGTIYIAQFAGVEFAAGFDHIFYGWIFFAIVVAIVLAGAWRFFEKEPEEFGLTTKDLEESQFVARIEGRGEGQLAVLWGVLALSMMAGFIAAIAA